LSLDGDARVWFFWGAVLGVAPAGRADLCFEDSRVLRRSFERARPLFFGASLRQMSSAYSPLRETIVYFIGLPRKVVKG
jgi:hypothetical protein